MGRLRRMDIRKSNQENGMKETYIKDGKELHIMGTFETLDDKMSLAFERLRVKNAGWTLKK